MTDSGNEEAIRILRIDNDRADLLRGAQSEMLPRAVAASSVTTQVATISGPAIGGILYAVSPTFVYALSATLFLCATLQLALLRLAPVTSTRPPLTLATFFAGLSYIRHNRLLLGVIMLDLFAVLLGGAAALLPVYAKDVFQVGPWGLGLLRSAPAAGALISRAVLTRTPLEARIAAERARLGLRGMWPTAQAAVRLVARPDGQASVLVRCRIGAADADAAARIPVLRSAVVLHDLRTGVRGRAPLQERCHAATAHGVVVR